MIHNLKALGLALLAVLALSAVAASSASAANDLFTSNSSNGKTDLTGANVAGTLPTWVIAGAQATCAQSSYAGTVVGNSVPEVTVHPVYGGHCTLAGQSATVDTDGCDYILTGTTDTVGAETHATVSLECTAGKAITITAPTLGITLHITPQNQLKGVTYTNKNTAESGAGNEALTVKFTLKSMVHHCTGSFCFLFENEGNGNTGTFTDDVIVTGYEDNGTWSCNATTHVCSGTHGPQKHISVSS